MAFAVPVWDDEGLCVFRKKGDAVMEKKLNYRKIEEGLQQKIREDRERGWKNPCRFQDKDALRRDMERDKASLWRPAFVRDTEKILHLPIYNRYADKTQVLSFYENDDLTRRALHVQLVSRIARNIGAVLGLNLDLIEAISLGHDIGHTPFGHAGERYLDQLLQEFAGLRFFHNVQSVRVLDSLFRRNLTLQSLDGILSHNGEFEQQEYRPRPLHSFDELDARVEDCMTRGEEAVNEQIPSTLEGCVVRICDMIAYLGKDRQDAITAHIIEPETAFTTKEIGTKNAAIINNMTVDIIENSYGKDYILLSPQTYRDLKIAKRENNALIYQNEAVKGEYEHTIQPMFRQVFLRLLQDLKEQNEASPIFRHHIAYVREKTRFYEDEERRDYLNQRPEQIVADYIASMTDDYFISLHSRLFPDSSLKIDYHSYFEDMQKGKTEKHEQ